MNTLNTRLWANQPDPVPANVPEPVPAPVQKKARTTRRARRAAERANQKTILKPKPIKPPKVKKPSRSERLRAKLEAKLREKADEPAMSPDARRGLMGVSRRGALVAITFLDLAATAVSFGESWDALYQWALHHGLHGFWAFAFPLQIDTFIAMGELALFIAIIDHWHWKNRIWAWVSVFGGLGVSMIGNIGHVFGHSLAWMATAAVPPLAAMAGMFIGFQVLKRVMNPSKAALQIEAETESDVIAQLRSQVEELSRVAMANVSPAGKHAAESITADRPEPAQAVHPDGFVLENHTKEPKPAPKTNNQPRPKRGQKHPKWDEGVRLYRESKTEDNPRGLSQRELARAMGMENRGLAARIIDHVDNSNDGEGTPARV